MVLTVFEALRLGRRVAVRTESGAKPPGWLPVWSASFSFASGVAIVAGVLPPFDFAQSLHQSLVLGGLLDLRFALTGTFLVVLIVSIGASAYMRVSRDQARLARIKDTLLKVESLPRGLNPMLAGVIRWLFPFFAFVVQLPVELTRWIFALVPETARIAWEVLLYKYFYRAAGAAFVRVAGLVLIGQMTFLIASPLISLLRAEAGGLAGAVPEFPLLGLSVLFAAGAVSGIYLVVWASMEDHKAFPYYAGRVIAVAFACWVIGAAFWGMRLAGGFKAMLGFDHPGAYLLTAPAILGITSILLLVEGRRNRRGETVRSSRESAASRRGEAKVGTAVD